VTRPLGPKAGSGYPDLSACPDGCADLLDRWETVLGRAPRLRPWLAQMLARRRLLLQESAGAEIERTLWRELSRWLRDFEALPQFAVSAIATTLQESEERPRAERAAEPRAAGESPERAVSDMETLLSDPAFALAFHCVESRLRPQLALSRVPEAAWFGLLHASAPARPLLTPDVAVALVLRVLSAGWAQLTPASRTAALRLFHATPSDLRGPIEPLRRLCDALPWGLAPADLPEFVAASARARAGLADAAGLCARIVASVARAGRGTRRGGLAILEASGAHPAAPDEMAELGETARKYLNMPGFRRLLALL